jgi:hypothetical protein
LRNFSKPDIKNQHETIEQTLLLIWLEFHFPEIYDMTCAIPLGGYRPNGEAAKMKAEGERAGYPDLITDIAAGGYHGLRVEMKKFCKSAKPSANQIERLTKLANQNYYVCVCRGHRAAINTYIDYFNLQVDKFPTTNDWETIIYRSNVSQEKWLFEWFH